MCHLLDLLPNIKRIVSNLSVVLSLKLKGKVHVTCVRSVMVLWK